MFQYLVFFLQNVPCCPVRFQLSRLNFPSSIIFVLVVMACSAPILADQPIKLPEKISFNAHIRPIMSDTCFTCHGPDEDDNPSGLRLDSFEMATEAAIVPGDAKSSAVFNGSPTKPTQCHPKSFAISCRITKKHSLKDGSTKARSTSNTGHGHHLLVPSLPLQKS